MAAVVYVRVETPDYEIQVNIVCVKTKVAPLKKLTIPRLELNAALMLSRLVTSVRTALALEDRSIFMWTDVLTWVKSHPAKWKDYIRNRVSAIQDPCPPFRGNSFPARKTMLTARQEVRDKRSKRA